jgi:hypothetical protein
MGRAMASWRRLLLGLPSGLACALLCRCSCDVEPVAPTPAPEAGDAGTLVVSPEDDAGAPEGDAGPTAAPGCVRVVFGENLPAAIAREIVELLERAGASPLLALSPAGVIAGDARSCAADELVLLFGRSEESPIEQAALAALGPEGWVIERAMSSSGARILAVDGNQGDGAGVARSPGGASFGAFELLEDLGFAFLHPLEPHIPSAITPEAVVARASAPRWPVRNVHLHTSHPIELSEVLNGFGPAGTDDEAGFQRERRLFRSFLTWLVAGGGNEAQWLLLEAASWAGFAHSDERQRRLAELVDDCRAFSVSCGITVPIVQHQQHSFRLITNIGDPVAEEAELRARLAWVLGAGFDFLVTSTGTTEFTHPSATQMLRWMDLVTQIAAEEHGVETRMNIHVSPGQVAEPFVDRETGEPLNFNFLPTWADPRLAVLPHTVQIYGLEDPAPTYGNSSFGFMREFLQEEVGRRRVVFHPETAYWVSVDVDVPLFLPVYAERRIADLQLLADDEDLGLMGRGENAGGRMDGQDVFTSGWEWSYWLNDLVALRASWDPFRGEPDAEGALRQILAPLARALGAEGDEVVAAVVGLARDQRALLIHGRVGGAAPAEIERRAGLAYLAGSEAFDDLAALAARLGIAGPKTQPFRLGLVEMRNPLHAQPRFSEVEPLLAEMAAAFAGRAQAAEAVLDGRTDPLAAELADSFAITRLRAAQIHALYQSVAQRFSAAGPARLADARSALDEASAVVARRAARYRMPADRIAAWRSNPTAYRFTYLWTAHTLWYWWRDEHLAADAPASPCVMNIIDPADVALGEGGVQSGAELLAALAPAGLAGAALCASAPSSEPRPPPRAAP